MDARAWTNVDEIRLFQSIPNLEVFEYYLGTPYHETYAYDYTPSRSHPLRAVSMRHMKNFHLFKSRFLQGITIFIYLALPPECKIYFRWNEHELSEPGLELALRHMCLASDALNQHFATALSQRMVYYQAVEIAGRSVRPLHIKGKTVERSHRLPLGVQLQAPLTDTDDMRMRPEPLLLTVLQPVFLQATYLSLALESTIDHDEDNEEWVALWINLHKYKKVTELYLSGCNFDYFVAYLRLREVRSYPRLFPALQTITISDFDFSRSAEASVKNGRSVLHEFGTAMDSAYGSSASFRRVHVGASCTGRKNAIKRLRLSLGIERVRRDAEA